MGNNLCLSVNGLIYSGGCTDKTFSDGACPALCTGETGSDVGEDALAQILRMQVDIIRKA